MTEFRMPFHFRLSYSSLIKAILLVTVTFVSFGFYYIIPQKVLFFGFVIREEKFLNVYEVDSPY